MPHPELYGLEAGGLGLSEQESAAIPRLIGAAALAVTAPRQSGFAVQMAAMNRDGNVVHAGNREYGLSRAYVHGEEAAVSKLFSTYPDSPLLGLGVYDEQRSPERLLLCPCGNCRDVLLEEASPDLLLAAGNSEVVLATRLRSFLYDVWQRPLPESVAADPMVLRAIAVASRACGRAVRAYLPERLHKKLYGVALLDQNSEIFSGSHYTTAGYDAVTPGVAAIQAFRNRPEDADGLAELRAVVVVGRGGTDFQPAYRDRNALAELDVVLQSENDTYRPTPVYVVSVDSEGNLQRSAVTDMQEWLPYAYTGQAERRHGTARVIRQSLACFL